MLHTLTSPQPFTSFLTIFSEWFSAEGVIIHRNLLSRMSIMWFEQSRVVHDSSTNITPSPGNLHELNSLHHPAACWDNFLFVSGNINTSNVRHYNDIGGTATDHCEWCFYAGSGLAAKSVLHCCGEWNLSLCVSVMSWPLIQGVSP